MALIRIIHEISNKSSVFDFDVIRISPSPKPLSTVITLSNSDFSPIKSIILSLILSKAASDEGTLSSFISKATDADAFCAAPFIDTVIKLFFVSSFDKRLSKKGYF